MDIRHSDSLDGRIEELINEAGGRTRAVLALMEHVGEREPAPDEGTRTVMMVRLTAEEARAIEAERVARGMSRAEWVRAVLRRQISDQRPLSRVDRGYLRKSVAELKALRHEITRLRCTVNQAAAEGRGMARQMRNLEQFERRLVAVAQAIHHGFLGEDSYWRRLVDGGPARPVASPD